MTKKEKTKEEMEGEIKETLAELMKRMDKGDIHVTGSDSKALAMFNAEGHIQSMKVLDKLHDCIGKLKEEYSSVPLGYPLMSNFLGYLAGAFNSDGEMSKKFAKALIEDFVSVCNDEGFPVEITFKDPTIDHTKEGMYR